MTLNTKKAVPKDLIDSLLADYKKPEDLIGENGLLKQLTKLLVERALDAEMSEHLGHDKNAPRKLPQIENNMKIEASISLRRRDEEVKVHGEPDCWNLG